MQGLIYSHEGKFLTGGDQALLSCDNFCVVKKPFFLDVNS